MLRMFTLLLAALLFLALAGCGDQECATCPETPAIFYVTKHKIDFGATLTTAVFTIVNKGEKDLTWTIDYGDVAWLEVSPTTDTNDKVITCTADRSKLPSLGVFRATIVVTSDGTNTQSDDIEVSILNGDRWLITDRGEADTCWAVDQFDYYWVKGFTIPDGLDAVFVDSLSFYFCEADTTIQLLAFSAQYNEEFSLYFPNNLIYASDLLYLVPSGWVTIPVNIYISTSPFYVGYNQIAATLPLPGIDTVSTLDTIGSRRARDFAENPDNPELYWEQNDSLETLLIRAFVSPVLEYNPKLAIPGNHACYEDLL